MYGIADFVTLFAEQVFIDFLYNIHNVPPCVTFSTLFCRDVILRFDNDIYFITSRRVKVLDFGIGVLFLQNTCGCIDDWKENSKPPRSPAIYWSTSSSRSKTRIITSLSVENNILVKSFSVIFFLSWLRPPWTDGRIDYQSSINWPSLVSAAQACDFSHGSLTQTVAFMFLSALNS